MTSGAMPGFAGSVLDGVVQGMEAVRMLAGTAYGEQLAVSEN